jgi:hypothetical protein
MGIAPPAPPVPEYDLFARLQRLDDDAFEPTPDRSAFTTAAAQLRAAGLAGDVAWAELAAAIVDHRTAVLGTLIEAAFDALRKDPWLRRGFVDRTLQALLDVADAQVGRVALRELLAEPFALGMLESTRRVTAESLAVRLKDWDSCARALDLAEPWPEWTRELLDLRVTCYEHARPERAAAARADLAAFDANAAKPLDDVLAPPTTRDYVPRP